MDTVKRFWEVDFLRGIAILMMVIFHILFDLDFYGIHETNMMSGFWMYFGRITASLFLLLVGVSLTISLSRQKQLGKTNLFYKYLKRGLKIFSWGLLISLFTWISLRDGYVRFGILHLIGVSIILAYPLLRYKNLNLLLGIILVIFGLKVNEVIIKSPFLLWLGIRPERFFSVDYYPLLPWFGLILIGIFIGNSFYTNYGRTVRIPELSNLIPIRFLSYLGKHSLLIYLLHQPLIILLFTLTGLIKFSSLF
ncbi:heparan-alpha-glucosaminide N-acetyltransferase [Nanoarchaeota archaeon]